MARATEFEQFIADEVEKNRGAMVPVKASMSTSLTRMTTAGRKR